MSYSTRTTYAIANVYGWLLGERRDSKWKHVRKVHLEKFPQCVWCGQEAETVHHIVPFSQDKNLELESSNLASMCNKCHFTIGHLCNWRKWNAKFRQVVNLLRY